MLIEILEVLITILSDIIGVNKNALSNLYKKFNLLKRDKKSSEILSDKIEELTASLKKSAELMSEIEVEFQNQKELADKWKNEAETSKIIASLNQNEVTAVAKIFGGQIEKESKKSNRSAILWGVLFCVIGLIGGYLISKYLL